MLQDIYKHAKEQMEKSIYSLQKEFGSLRSGRVNINLLNNIRVNYYGSLTPLSQVSTIVAQDAATIIVTPWEKTLLKDIEKAIQEANIGVNPNVDSDNIRLFFPPMSFEQRKESAKQARNIGEKIKIAIRSIRQDCNNNVKKLEKDKIITNDENKKGMDEIQKITDEFIKKIDLMVKAKEDEILKM